MKWKTIFLLLFIFYAFTIATVHAQYEIKSSYLINTESTKGFVDSSASFWLDAYDSTYGGFYTDIQRNGTSSGTRKTLLTQSRNAYGMARAFQLTGDTTYLVYARGALDFMYDHAWDNINDGWYEELERQGSVQELNEDKWSFMQHYALVGIAAMVEATQDSKDQEFLLKGFQANNEHLWDSREGYLGYYNRANTNWSNPREKGFTPTVDGITTHALSMYLMTKGASHKTRLLQMADNIVDYLIPSMDNRAYGFAESYDADWNINTSDTFVFTGHVLKAAWCLLRAYHVEPKTEYIESAQTLINEVLNLGYDHTYGGCYSNYNGATGVRFENNKNWWQLEQAFTAGIMAYYLTQDDKYLEMADESLDFFMTYFVDLIYGEVYYDTNQTGGRTGTDDKGGYWKAAYHSIELGYYVYLYGNLFYHDLPVTLYYHFEPVDTAREMILYPLAIKDDNLKITNVTQNGESYADYDDMHRVLHLPAGIGGKFQVTFKNTGKTTGVENVDNVVDNFELYQNYPNPFNPITNIQYDLPKESEVSLIIYNILGQEIIRLVDNKQQSGKYIMQWNGKNQSGINATSGLYIYRIVAKTTNGQKFTKIRKLILLK